MARKVIETFTDDIDGSEGATTVRFSYGAQEYEIDLAAKNANKLDKALMEFIPNARRVGKKTQTTSKTGRSKEELAAIRAWATYAGKPVSERGRIPQAILDEFDAAR